MFINVVTSPLQCQRSEARQQFYRILTVDYYNNISTKELILDKHFSLISVNLFNNKALFTLDRESTFHNMCSVFCASHDMVLPYRRE